MGKGGIRDEGSSNGTNEKRTQTTKSPSMWLRSCEKETVEPIEGTLSGEVPPWLSGRLTRNGPGKFHFGDTQYNHLFDGSAYLHQFNIQDGKVTYQSRFLQCDSYKKNSKVNRIVASEFGTVAYPDPCKTLYQRFMSMFDLPGTKTTDNCLVNVVYMGDQLFALTETSYMRRVDPETLDCVGEKTKLDDYIAVNQATAHPHIDPDGTVYNMGSAYRNKKGPTYNIIKFPPPKEVDGKELSSVEQAEIVASFPCQWKMYPSYYHSYGITDNYFIFVEQPLVMNVKKLLFRHFLGKSALGALEWYPNEKCKFRVVRRDTGELLKTTYTANSFFTFHHTNAYEKDGQLVIDLAAVDDGSILDQVMLKNFKNPDHEWDTEAAPNHRRFVLPLCVDDAKEDTNLVTLEGSTCTAFKKEENVVEVGHQLLADQFFDLPRINYKHNGKEYTYAYGVEVQPVGIELSKLVKMNVRTGECKVWHEEGKVVSEPVFIAAPEALKEDQGIILSSLLQKDDPTFVALLVLNAETWEEMARVEFKAQGAVTSTFHGQFAAAGDTVHRY